MALEIVLQFCCLLETPVLFSLMSISYAMLTNLHAMSGLLVPPASCFLISYWFFFFFFAVVGSPEKESHRLPLPLILLHLCWDGKFELLVY